MKTKTVFFALSLCLLAGCYEITYGNQGTPNTTPGNDAAAVTENEIKEDIYGHDGDGIGAEETEPDTVHPTGPCGAFSLGVVSSCEESVSNYSASPFFMVGDEPILHMIGVYEATSEHSFGYHPPGTAVLHVGRTLRSVVLVLSSYEPVEWAIDRAPGAVIEKIVLYGYYAQTVSGVNDVLVIDRSNGQFYGYGYCWPGCSGGSDTQAVVADAEAVTGLQVSTFSGCYHLEEMILTHDCYSDCTPEFVCAGWQCGVNEACGVDCGRCSDAGSVCIDHRCIECGSACAGRVCGDDGCGGSCGTCPSGYYCVDGVCDADCVWNPSDFLAPADPISCEGRHFVRFDERYGLWVGLVQCSTGLRFYLSESRTGPFYPATDTAGHGQDFCELVDPSFTIPNEDDITSGGCSGCSTGRNCPLEGVTAWERCCFGEQFELIESTGTWSWQASVVNCAVDISREPGAILFCQ